MSPDQTGSLFRKDFWTGRHKKVGVFASGHNESIDDFPPSGVDGPLLKTKPLQRGDTGNYNADKVAEALEKKEN